MNTSKYAPYEPVGLPDRTWPGKQITEAPLWASVDLRDGNQALINPMDLERKRTMFDLLVSLGFKEIEIGYPTASRDDYDFVRHLVETDAIPHDVVIQVMTPIIGDLIERTVASLAGARRAVLQVFNPTSEAQRRLVFRKTRSEVKALALAGAEQALRLQDALPGTEIFLQYAPESFTQTEPDYALEVCNAVLEFWARRAEHTLAVNLPATVEVYPPQEFADRIEYVSRYLAHRERVLLSVHPHNDRGSGVAAAEMAVLAGADRVEGTLFGNGERTGNVCLITLAMNLFSQGVDPMLDLRDLDRVRRTVEQSNRMPISHRHPWAGDFVYTSFAGTHQDAIAKGLKARGDALDAPWDVPYLPIDPRDIGRDYQSLIRINSQSGKGGIAHLLHAEYGVELPRRLQIDFAAAMQQMCETHESELTTTELWQHFRQRYIDPSTEIDTDPPATHDDMENGPAGLAERLLALYGVEGTVQELVLGRTGAGHQADSAACEILVDARSFWGVGLAPSEDAAVRAAVRSAVSQIRKDTAPTVREVAR
ncbi:2-isopropylmalate synthase [Streptomyces sp. NBC_01092]|uniref:2-isopropylmalate synthase n=1 Tax=Streptomyces sp. NBC_01092 TaxID=2903748 RepID=UPI0038700A46|nr:2-isopropylmalate synthase [Streptomyces sp. NBC_01092]